MINIGLVEDSRVFRNELVRSLSNYSQVALTIVANTGLEFLEKIKTIEPGLIPEAVLVDIEMPGMNGIETINIAKELFPKIQFIILTTFDDDEKLFEAIKAGASGYLLKEEKTERIVEALITANEGAPMSPTIARKALTMLKEQPKQIKSETEEHLISEREMDVLKLSAEGLGYRQIAERLFISPLTVRKHIINIYRKLHVNSKLSAIKVAQKKGWFR